MPSASTVDIPRRGRSNTLSSTSTCGFGLNLSLAIPPLFFGWREDEIRMPCVCRAEVRPGSESSARAEPLCARQSQAMPVRDKLAGIAKVPRPAGVHQYDVSGPWPQYHDVVTQARFYDRSPGHRLGHGYEKNPPAYRLAARPPGRRPALRRCCHAERWPPDLGTAGV